MVAERTVEARLAERTAEEEVETEEEVEAVAALGTRPEGKAAAMEGVT